MCNDTTLMPIPSFIEPFKFDPTHAEYGIDEQGRRCFAIDSCIVPALEALWAAGIKTVGSCCGHGSGTGVIGLGTWRDDRPIDEHPATYRPIEGRERPMPEEVHEMIPGLDISIYQGLV